MNDIILYTIHCPKCNVLEKKLQQKGIQFDIVDDEEIIMQKGFKSAPILVVGDTVLEFSKAIDWLKEQ